MRSRTKHGVGVTGIGVVAAMVLGPFAVAQPSGTVKITPLGARTGEYCARDRALIFEDPTGVRILYDPGITVAGGEDSRLGDVHAILVTHNHFDHIGYQKLTQSPDDPHAICDTGLQPTQPALLAAQTGNTNTAEIAAAKNSAVLVNANMAEFLAGKIENIRGFSTPSCFPVRIEGPRPNELRVPRFSPCTGELAFGSSRTVTLSPGAPGVRINVVAALHSDGVFNPSLMLKSSLNGNMEADHLTAYGGLANGYVLTFTNGLKVYLTGDTGPISDMSIIRDLYHPQLAVVNMDGVNTMGPEEAEYAMKQLVRPAAIIVSHAEEAVTSGGRVNSDTRTAQFIGLMGDMPVYVPLSGRTMEFDGNAKCIVCPGQTPPADNPAPGR